MPKADMRVYNYLRRRGAYGKRKAIPADIVARATFRGGSEANKRAVRAEVTAERTLGAFICASTEPGANGYYLPADEKEALEEYERVKSQLRKRETRILKPMENAIGRIRKRKQEEAEGVGLFPEECPPTPLEFPANGTPIHQQEGATPPAEPHRPSRNEGWTEPPEYFMELIQRPLHAPPASGTPKVAAPLPKLDISTMGKPMDEEAARAWKRKHPEPLETVTGEPLDYED